MAADCRKDEDPRRRAQFDAKRILRIQRALFQLEGKEPVSSHCLRELRGY